MTGMEGRPMGQHKLREGAWQALLLILIAGLVAVTANHVRTDRLPLVGDWSAEARIADPAGKSLIVSLEEAARLDERQEALFVDARPRDAFAAGHIAGALNLPFQEVDHYFVEVADRLDPEKTLVAYCDGKTCELSHELALFLKEMGYEDVRVLVNGWTVWRQAGLPTESGGRLP
jgi:rhodanese-related sulfurtransferase